MKKEQNLAEILIDRLMVHLKAKSITELAFKLGTSQSTISSWKQRNSVNAIKAVCIVGGFHDKIFKDLEKINDLKLNKKLLKKITIIANYNDMNATEYLNHLMLNDIKSNKEILDKQKQ